MPFIIIRQDIVKMSTDAIVNAANSELQMGGGVCGAIFRAAGVRELQAACARFAPIKTGEAVITPGFASSAKYIIHAVGPVYRDGQHGEAEQLRNAYTNSLRLAVENNCESIAFPLIASGIYGYPKDEALRVATAAIQDFIAEHDIEVFLVVWDKQSFVVSTSLLGEVESYIDENYIEEYPGIRYQWEVARSVSEEKDVQFCLGDTSGAAGFSPANLEDLVGNLDEPFAATLMRLIESTGKKDVEIYRRANIDRRLFSKIRNKADYVPSKQTVLAFAIALELTPAQTDDLLERAGFALSPCRKFDVIVSYFIANGKYNIYQINEVLFHYDQPLLGG